MTRHTDAICVVRYVYSLHVRRIPVKNLFLPLSCKSLKTCKFNNAHSYAQNMREEVTPLNAKVMSGIFIILSTSEVTIRQVNSAVSDVRGPRALSPLSLSPNGRSTLTDTSNVRQTSLWKQTRHLCLYQDAMKMMWYQWDMLRHYSSI
jgi:hypothetical protein